MNLPDLSHAYTNQVPEKENILNCLTLFAKYSSYLLFKRKIIILLLYTIK